MEQLRYTLKQRGFINTLIISSIIAASLNFWNLALADGGARSAFVFSPTSSRTPSPVSDQAATATSDDVTPATAAPSSAPDAQIAAQATSSTGNPTVTVTARLSRSGLKPDYAALYLAASARTGTPWQLLAAVHRVETGQSDSTSRASSAGAIGPMQFMPATFRVYGLDGNGDGVASITNVDDAVYSAGRYLAAGGAAHGSYSKALYQYNHSNSYVSKVLGIADGLGL